MSGGSEQRRAAPTRSEPSAAAAAAMHANALRAAASCSPSAATRASAPRRSSRARASPAARSTTTSRTSGTCSAPCTSSSSRSWWPSIGEQIARDRGPLGAARHRRARLPRRLHRPGHHAHRAARRPGRARLGGVARDRRPLRPRPGQLRPPERHGPRRLPRSRPVRPLAHLLLGAMAEAAMLIANADRPAAARDGGRAAAARAARGPAGLGKQDDLAELAAGLRSARRPPRPRRAGRSPATGTVERAGLEERQHLALHQAHRDRLLLERAGAQRRAVDARALAHQRQQVELGLGAGRPRRSPRSGRRWRAPSGCRPGSGPPPARAPRRRARARRSPRDRSRVAPSCSTCGAQLLAAHGGRHARARRRGRAGPRRCPRRRPPPCTSRRSPGRSPAWREERVVGGREDLREPAGLGPVEPVRAPASRRARAPRPARPGRPPPTTAITRSPSAKRSAPGPTRRHLAGQLEPGDVGRRARAERGSAPRALEHVGAVEPGGPHPHQHLAGAGLGVGALLDHELAVLDRHRTHAGEI